MVNIFCFIFFPTAVRGEKSVGLNLKEHGVCSNEIKEM